MTGAAELSFIHRFVPATVPTRPPLLLLHGTGGNEDDLLALGAALAPGAALLSPRGKVSEGGMPRFFCRLAEGVFDPDEVRRRADELAGFVAAARGTYGIAAPIAVGFSNGANIAGVVLQRHPGVLAGAVLLRPMTVLDDVAVRTGAVRPGTAASVFMASGASDPIVPAASAEALAAKLREAGVEVDHQIVQAGHNLTQTDVTLAKAWFDQQR